MWLFTNGIAKAQSALKRESLEESLENKVMKLRIDVNALNAKPFVGEVYLFNFRYMSSHPVYSNANAVKLLGNTSGYNTFIEFKEADVTDSIGDKSKIFGVWVDKKDIIRYDSVFTKQKNAIEARYSSVGKKA